MSHREGDATLIVNFDFVGSCRGSCPSCTLSEVERAAPYAFLTGAQMADALEQALQGIRPPDFLALGLGRGNTLALDSSEHDHVFELARAARRLAPQARRVIELSTSLIEAPAKQRQHALALMEGVAAADPDAECRLVVVLDVSKTSRGYWDNIASFVVEMSEWRGGGDGSADILALNISVGALPRVDSVLERIRDWRGPVNVQWLVSGESAVIDAPALQELRRWLLEFARGAQPLGLDCNLLNVPQSVATDFGGSAMTAIDEQVARLGWVNRAGILQRGAFTMLGDYAAAASVRPDSVAARMMRHAACRGCDQLRSCIRAGGFAPALEALRRGRVEPAVCPSGLRDVLAAQTGDDA